MSDDPRHAIATARWQAQNYRTTGGYHRAADLEREADELELAAGLPPKSVAAAPPFNGARMAKPEFHHEEAPELGFGT